jgi:hypothetical protein
MKYQDKFKKQISYSIEYYEFDDLIKEVYGIDYESIIDQDNDSTLKINVDGKFDDYDETNLEFFLNSEVQEYYTNRLLLNDLYRKGLIEPGLYLINISW